jgi:hypothetical protein
VLRAGRLRFAGLGDEDDESTERCELVHGDWSGFRVGDGGTVGDAEDLADVRPVIGDWRTVKQNDRARGAGAGLTHGTT